MSTDPQTRQALRGGRDWLAALQAIPEGSPHIMPAASVRDLTVTIAALLDAVARGRS